MGNPNDTVARRNWRVPAEKGFKLRNGEALYTLDDLSEAINVIDPETFHFHVNESKNDFASWVQDVFGEPELAQQLRELPTPLRMVVNIEKFLHRSNNADAQRAA